MRAQRPVLSLGTPWAAPGAFTGHQKACWCSCGLCAAGVRGRVNRGLERTAAGAKARARCPCVPAGAQIRTMGAQQVHDGPGAPQQAFALAVRAVGAVRLRAAASAFLERRRLAVLPRAPQSLQLCDSPDATAAVCTRTETHSGTRASPRCAAYRLWDGVVAAALARAMALAAFLRRLAVTRAPPQWAQPWVAVMRTVLSDCMSPAVGGTCPTRGGARRAALVVRPRVHLGD
jgi:hypothetical protein